MKIALSISGNDLDSATEKRFGRASGFLIVDEDSLEFDYLDNSAGVNASHGAGIQTARLVADAGAKAVITGFVGPKAYDALQAAGIVIYNYEEPGTARQALEKFKAGQLSTTSGANRQGHWR